MNYLATIDTCIRQLLVFPSVIILIAAIIFCREAYIICLAFWKKKRKTKNLVILARIGSVMVCCVLLWINCVRLKRGISLPFEDESQAIILTGTVDHIERDRYSPRFYPTFETDPTYSYGGTIVIDGEAYYCLSTRDWQAGDVVTISVLPRSRIILRCEKQKGDSE